MRKQLATPLASAVLGGAVTALVLLGAGVVESEPTRTVFQQSPLTAAAGPALGGGERRRGDAEALTARDIYDRDAAGVVYIEAMTLARNPDPLDPYATPEDQRSSGSGFVLDADGRILTNAHVIEGATAVTVSFGEDTEARRARVVGKDESTDLAVLQVDADGLDLHPLELGRSADLNVGDPAVAIGNPFGFDRTLTTGIVSALQRRITAPDGYTIDDVIQTDAAINPGNSGGPLIDATGRVIGINSQIATGGNGGTGSVGIGFAVPIDTAKDVVRELIDHGQVKRPWMGVEITPIDARVAALDLPEDQGLLVQRVVPGSPAAGGGVQGGTRSVILNTGEEMVLGGDVITRIAGHVTDTAADLSHALEDHEPGERVDVTVRRDGQTITLPVELGNRPAGAVDD